MGQDQLFFSAINILIIIKTKYKMVDLNGETSLETPEVVEMKTYVAQA